MTPILKIFAPSARSPPSAKNRHWISKTAVSVTTAGVPPTAGESNASDSIAGVLLTKYCPDPVLFETREAWEAASVNAHYIWYYFAVIGLVAAIALFVFAKTTEFIDKKKKA